ncbi:hypothetical protein MMC07_005792 [Pseudocyphellaria aurata]|nr:hypothetical protein [Pseudocyphellaria aurata]
MKKRPGGSEKEVTLIYGTSKAYLFYSREPQEPPFGTQTDRAAAPRRPSGASCGESGGESGGDVVAGDVVVGGLGGAVSGGGGGGVVGLGRSAEDVVFGNGDSGNMGSQNRRSIFSPFCFPPNPPNRTLSAQRSWARVWSRAHFLPNAVVDQPGAVGRGKVPRESKDPLLDAERCKRRTAIFACGEPSNLNASSVNISSEPRRGQKPSNLGRCDRRFCSDKVPLVWIVGLGQIDLDVAGYDFGTRYWSALHGDHAGAHHLDVSSIQT